MTSATMINGGTRTGAELKMGIGRAGRVLVSFTVAGGVLAGGFLVAAMTLAGKLSGNALMLTSGALYLMGALLGFLHGAALGFFGRGETSVRTVVKQLGLATLYTIPLLAIGFTLAAGWIAMTTVALYAGKVPALLLTALGWVAGLAIVLTAVAYGWSALRSAYARWSHAQLGTVLVAATFAALMVVFLADRPMLWGMPFRVTEVGAVLLAWFATVWVAGPVVTLALSLVERMQGTPVLNGHGRTAWSGIVLGLAVGFVLSLIALPFYQPPVSLATPVTGAFGGVVVAVSQALLSEVLLRVFLVTGVIWLALSWQNVRPQQAALFAVTIAALVQVVLYLPGVLALGLPSWMATIGYVLAAVLVPGLAFGFLYVKRGLTAALAGHAAALIALALLA